MSVYKNVSDRELSILLREGDKAAYTEIYQRYYRLLFVHSYKKLRNEEEAKDLIHELFASLWKKRDTIDFNGNLVGYLYISMRNRVLDYFSHKDVESKYITSLQHYIDIDNAKTDYRIREKDLLEFIKKEIQALPPKMKEVFELSRNEYLSHKEIGEKLDISEQTVSKHISNALRTLRVKLGASFLIFFLIVF